ncbi:unnamed protein product [Closterium sp. NIES-54]
MPLWRRMLQSSIDAHAHIPSASFVQLATLRANHTPANRTLVFRRLYRLGSAALASSLRACCFHAHSCPALSLPLLLSLPTAPLILSPQKHHCHLPCTPSHPPVPFRFPHACTSLPMQVKEIEDSPFVELCWYFSESWEQYRISGSMCTVHAKSPDPALLQLRHAAWQPLTVQQRWQYCRGHPGTPWEEDSEGGADAAGRPDGHESSLAALALLTQPVAEGSSADDKVEPEKAESDKVASVEPVEGFCVLLLEPHEVDYVHVRTPSRHRHTRRLVDEGKGGAAGGRGYEWTASRIHL